MVRAEEVLARMEYWIGARSRPRFIAVTNMHGIMESRRYADFRQVLDSADLSLPDGLRVVRIAHRRGFTSIRQLTGMDLMLTFGPVAAEKHYTSFFYGDTGQVLDRVQAEMRRRFPGFPVAGAYSPPFRPLTAQEDTQIVREINQSRPDVLWVGMGLPKQERWIYEHRERLDVPVLVAVGAAFKFIAGTVQRAPVWMQQRGLEWVWRLSHEPRRLWHRVFVYGPQFLLLTSLERYGLRQHE